MHMYVHIFMKMPEILLKNIHIHKIKINLHHPWLEGASQREA